MPHHACTATICLLAALQVISKLLTAAGTDPHISAHLLGCLQTLASPATDAQAVAVCEGVLATKPPVVPWLLKQLEQSAGGPARVVAAAALGALFCGVQVPPCSLLLQLLHVVGCNASELCTTAQVTACMKWGLAVLQAALHALKQCMSVGAPAVCTARTHACCPPHTFTTFLTCVTLWVAAWACSQVCCMPCWAVLRRARQCTGSWQVGACSRWLQPSRRSRCGAATKTFNMHCHGCRHAAPWMQVGTAMDAAVSVSSTSPQVVFHCLSVACTYACPQSLPLLGGRHASAHAAAVLELLCAPPAPSAAAAQAGGTGKDSSGTKDGKKSRAGSAASSKASAGAAGGADRSLSSVLQQGVLAAGGLPALLKVGQYCRQQPLGPGPARLTHTPYRRCDSCSLPVCCKIPSGMTTPHGRQASPNQTVLQLHNRFC